MVLTHHQYVVCRVGRKQSAIHFMSINLHICAWD